METLKEFVGVGCGRDIIEGNPGVFFWRQACPTHEVLVALSKLAAVEELGDASVFPQKSETSECLHVRALLVSRLDLVLLALSFGCYLF